MCVCACFHLPNVSNVKYDVNSIIRFSNVCCLFGFRERFQMSLGQIVTFVYIVFNAP